MVNGEEIAVGGFPENAVVALTFVGHKHAPDHPCYSGPDEGWDWSLSLNGLHSPEPGNKQHVDWADVPLDIGDRATVEVVETQQVSAYKTTRRSPPRAEPVPPAVLLERLRDRVTHLEVGIAAMAAAQPLTPKSSPTEALQIQRNRGNPIVCGFADCGVVTALLARRPLQVESPDGQSPDHRWGWELSVGGLHFPESDVDEDVSWLRSELRVGDTVEVVVVQREDLAEPVETQRRASGPMTSTPESQLKRLRTRIAELEAEIAEQEAD